MRKPADQNGERTLSTWMYQRLRHDIIAGELAPGSKLKLERLINDYGIGMSPLREALARLVSDQLVVSKEQRGFWVAPLSLEELEDVSRVRALVETEALSLSIRNGGPEWEAQVRASFEALEAAERELQNQATPSEAAIEQWENRNRAFHVALVSACNSPWLMRLRDQLYQQAERYRRISLKVSRGRRFVHDEHQSIFEAAMQRNALKACRITEEHVQRTAEEVKRAGAAMSSSAGNLRTDAKG